MPLLFDTVIPIEVNSTYNVPRRANTAYLLYTYPPLLSQRTGGHATSATLVVRFAAHAAEPPRRKVVVRVRVPAAPAGRRGVVRVVGKPTDGGVLGRAEGRREWGAAAVGPVELQAQRCQAGVVAFVVNTKAVEQEAPGPGSG